MFATARSKTCKRNKKILQGDINSNLDSFTPYSQVYRVHQDSEGETRCIFRSGNSPNLCQILFLVLRHYLHTAGMTEEELQSIRVAACAEEEQLESHLTNQDKTTSQVKFGRAHKKSSTQTLLSQMNAIVKPIVAPGEGEPKAGVLVITVHKANNVEKKGLVGKADPYVVLQYGQQKIKSLTVNNNQNPVWHLTGYLDIEQEGSPELLIELFDEDVGKDESLGQTIIDIQEMCRGQEMVNNWIALENCSSGEILVSGKFVPHEEINKKIGKIYVTVQKAKKIEKKNMMKKADPYVIIKLGKDEYKTPTVKNNSNPSWNFKAEIDLIEGRFPRQLCFEVFDEDIGNDAALGNFTIDTDAIMKKEIIEQMWTKLENCKTGEVLISASFVPNAREEKVPEPRKHDIIQSVQEVPVAAKIKILEPDFVDEEFLVVEKRKNTWFMASKIILNI